MEFLEDVESKRDNKGRLRKWGLFKCPYCLQEVERDLSGGKKQKSCGCIGYILTAEFNKGKKHTEEHNKKIGLANKGKKQSSEAKQKQIEAQKGKKRKPFTEEHIQKMKESHTGKIGELAPNWQNGKSFEEYGIEFNKKFKQNILERDNYTCQDPNCKYEIDILDCHHIDYDKNNNNPDNLITLCRSCHMKTNWKKKRLHFTEYYQKIMMGKIMECLL